MRFFILTSISLRVIFLFVNPSFPSLVNNIAPTFTSSSLFSAALISIAAQITTVQSTSPFLVLHNIKSLISINVENYLSWKSQFEPILISNNLLGLWIDLFRVCKSLTLTKMALWWSIPSIPPRARQINAFVFWSIWPLQSRFSMKFMKKFYFQMLSRNQTSPCLSIYCIWSQSRTLLVQSIALSPTMIGWFKPLMGSYLNTIPLSSWSLSRLTSGFLTKKRGSRLVHAKSRSRT